MSYSVTIPDFAGTLQRGEQSQVSRLQALAMQEQMADQRGSRALLAQHGPALLGGDAAAQQSALQALAVTPGGLQLATPFWQQAQQRVRPMSPEERAQWGVRGNFAVDGSGRPVQVEASDTMSAAAEAQRLRIAAASRAPPAPMIVPPGASVVGRDGRPMFTAPGPQQSPFESNQGGVMQVLSDLAPRVAGGTATPQEQRNYAIAVAAFQRQGAQAVERVNPATGAIERVLVPGPIPEGFPAPIPFGQPAPTPQPPPAAGAPDAPFAPRDPNAPRVLSTTQQGAAPMTEAQSRDNYFGAQMRMGDDNMRGVQVPSAAALLAWRNAPESAVNMALSSNDQQYFNALRLFAAGVLRKETGAAFTANELLDVQSRFFPMPGDSPQVIAQKERARSQAIRSVTAAIPGGLRGAGEPGIPGPGGVGTASPPPRVPAPPPGFEIVR